MRRNRKRRPTVPDDAPNPMRPIGVRDRDRLHDAILSQLHDQYRAWTIDMLLLYPRKAQAFARDVLTEIGHRPINESSVRQVLQTALNLRKAKRLSRDRV